MKLYYFPKYGGECAVRHSILNERRKLMKNSDFLRQQVKLCKVYNPEWSYKQMAEVLNISTYGFYNWLHGYYELSNKREAELRELIADLMEE